MIFSASSLPPFSYLQCGIKGNYIFYLIVTLYLHLFVSSVSPNRGRTDHVLPAPEAVEIAGNQVTIDYSKWLEEVRLDTYFIRVVLKKRKVSDKIDDDAPFELEDELSKFFSSRTVKGLEGRTTYEFITEAVQLSEQGGEVFGHRSGILRVETPCSGEYWSLHSSVMCL